MAKKFKITIVTPDGKKVVDEAEILNCVTSGGAIGVLAGHLPLVSVLEISHLNYKKDGEKYEFAVSGGIVNVKKDEVIVLAESFETKEEIDKARAEAAKERASKRINNESDEENIDVARAELALKKALNRLSL